MEEAGRGREECAKAKHNGDFANLAKGGVGQHAFDVPLFQGHQLAVEQRGDAESCEARAIPGQAEITGRGRESLSHLAGADGCQSEEAHLGDDTGKRGGDGARGGRMGVRQPGVHGNEAGLYAEAGDAENESRLNPAGRQVENAAPRCRGGDGVHGGEVAGAGENEDAGQHEEGAAGAHDIVFEAG